jgi:hypothetical protein
MKTKNIGLKIFYVLSALMFTFFLVMEFRFFLEEKESIVGWVTGVSPNGSTITRIDYEFKVKTIRYSGYDTKIMRSKDCNCEENDSLIIVYSIEDPTDSRIEELSCH